MPETNDIKISNAIHLDKRNLDPGTISNIRLRFSYDNPKYLKNRRLGFSNYSTNQTIDLYQENETCITFPRGLIGDVFKLVQNRSLDDKSTANPVDFPEPRITLRPYQKKAVAAMVGKNQGVLDAVVASGKTVMMCEIMARLRQKNASPLPYPRLEKSMAGPH